MVDVRLIAYFQNGLERGVKPSSLKEDLISQGFPNYEVDAAYRQVKKNYSFGSNTVFYKLVKRFILILLIIGFFGLLYVAFMALSFDELELTTDLHSKGVYFLMETGKLEVIFEGHVNKVRIREVGLNRIDIYLNGVPESLSIGVPRPFDLNGDLVKETVIELISIDLDKLYFYFVDYIDCISEWDCSDWTLCKGGSQSRECFDINNCGLNETAPIVKKDCEGLLDVPIY